MKARCVALADVPAELESLRNFSTAVIQAFVYWLEGMPVLFTSALKRLAKFGVPKPVTES